MRVRVTQSTTQRPGNSPGKKFKQRKKRPRIAPLRGGRHAVICREEKQRAVYAESSRWTPDETLPYVRRRYVRELAPCKSHFLPVCARLAGWRGQPVHSAVILHHGEPADALKPNETLLDQNAAISSLWKPTYTNVASLRGAHMQRQGTDCATASLPRAASVAHPLGPPILLW